MLGARARGRWQQRLTRIKSAASIGAIRAKDLSTVAAREAAKHGAVAARRGQKAMSVGLREGGALVRGSGAMAKGAVASTALRATKSWRHAKKRAREARENITWEAIKPTVYLDGTRLTVEFGPTQQIYVRPKLRPGDARRETELPKGMAASCAAFLCLCSIPCMFILAFMWDDMEPGGKAYLVRRVPVHAASCVARVGRVDDSAPRNLLHTHPHVWFVCVP